MLKRYSKIVDEYKTWYPNLYSRTIECKPSGKYSILALLSDGSRVEYNFADNTIRDVTKLYNKVFVNEMNEETWRQEFGRKLRKVILDKGTTQEKLSELTGISRQMLTRYVRGNSTPSGYVLSKLTEALECDVRELIKFGYLDE